MRILVSGFEPFLDERVNPTEMIANYINSCSAHTNKAWSSLDVRGVILPVLFDQAYLRLDQECDLFRPDVILCFGLAGGSTSIKIERRALNFRGGSATQRVDNNGMSAKGEIVARAPASLETTLPVALLIDRLCSRGIPAEESMDAGSYVCNDLFFQLQNKTRFSDVVSGFIHVPRLEKEWDWPRFENAADIILSSFC